MSWPKNCGALRKPLNPESGDPLESLHIVWVTLLVGLPVVITASSVLRIRRTRVLALMQDSSPVVLVLAWIALVIAIGTGAWILAAFSGTVAMYHAYILMALVRSRPVPRWVEHAPRTSVAVANIYVGNDQLEAASSQLLAAKADVLVVVETSPEFRRIFDEAGASTLYPFRTFDPEDRSDYAASMYSRHKPLSLEMICIGELPAARAVVDCNGVSLEILGVIPSAAVDPGGYERWHRQMDSLLRYARASSGPLVVAGDLNTTIHRAAYQDVRDTGLDDAHDDLGLGLRPSFKLAAKGILSKLGPLVRLDHALTNRWVWPIEVVDLEPIGSDHRPFVVTLAPRSPHGSSRQSPTP